MYKECFNIPKIELHSHIGGCVRPETFLELAQKKNISIDNLDFYNVDLKMAFEIFKLGPKLFTDLATLDRIVREIIHDYAKFNTIYLELRTTPKDFESSTKEEYIDTLVKAMKEEEENNPRIKVRLLLSINRSQSIEAAKELVDLALKFQ